MLVKFFDEQVNLPKHKLEYLYYMMADVNTIDKWHKYMTNPQPICDFECVYDWRDDVRNKTFPANSKFTMIRNKELQYVHYTITPLRYNPYYHNSVQFSFIGEFRMERWWQPRIGKDIYFNLHREQKNYLTTEQRQEMLLHHAKGIFSHIAERITHDIPKIPNH